MKQLFFTTLISLLFIIGCNPKEMTNKKSTINIHSKPELVVQTVFDAAKSKDFSTLTGLCDPEGRGDGDTKRICAVGMATSKDKKEFIEYFENARIVGEASINGTEARVSIIFGPKSNKPETFVLIKRNDNWYLESI